MKVGLFPPTNSFPTPDDLASTTSNSICRDGITGFRKLHKIGFGTYGSIYLAIHRSTDALFALKKFKFPEDKADSGLPRSAIREIRILRELTGHPNIVDCFGVLVSSGNDTNRNKGSIYMVLGFADHDLVGLLELWKRKLTVPEVKCICLQVLRAIDHCHLHGIVHRDLKCANILIDRGGVAKLADFGLAREYTTDPSLEGPQHGEALNMTNKVITLWYRPPELLLGATQYGSEIDMWSMGAILAELLLQRPLFSADKEMGVFQMILDELGSPVGTKAETEFSNLPLWTEFTALRPPVSPPITNCKTEIALTHSCSRNSWLLVSQMLTFNIQGRISAAAAMEHPLFAETPLACTPAEIRLPQGEFCHGMGMKQKRDRERGDDRDSKKSRN